MKEVGRVELRTSGYTFLHDFALTPTHYVLMVCPVVLDPALFLLGVESAAASVKWQEGKPSEIHMLGRPVIDAPTAPKTQNQQRQQYRVGNGHSNGAGKHNSQQEAVKPSAHQQQPPLVQQQQQQQQDLSKKRHVPEHLVSQVGTLLWVLLTWDWFADRVITLGCNGSSAWTRRPRHRGKCMPVACCGLNP